ncbi:MAG TPA: hypothetical protein VGF45_11035 [Polyangia bacterium]
MRAPLVAALVLTSILGVSCGEDFPPYNRLTTARVLAIAAEPSMPGPGETTTLRAFTYVPEVGAGFEMPGVSYSWSWCPFPSTDGTTCDVSALAPLGITPASLDLGQGSSAAFTHSVPVEVLQAICAMQPGGQRLFDCLGGFPIQIRVKTTFTGATVSPTGTDEIITVSTLRLRFSDQHLPNVSPVIEGLQGELPIKVTGEEPQMGEPKKKIFSIGVERDPETALPRDEETVIRALIPDSSIELFNGRNNDQVELPIRETLQLSWFVETGNTQSAQTTYYRNVRQDPQYTMGDREISKPDLANALDNKWIPAKVKDYAKNTAHIIVIVRDNRGGVAVRDGFVNLEEGP